MSKIILRVTIFTFLFFITFLKDEPNIVDLNVEFSKEFKSYVIKYLKDNSLYKKDSISIDKKTFKKIFKEILSSGDDRVFKVFEIFKDMQDKVCNALIKEIYRKGTKTIKASELEKYLEYDPIMNKFNKYLEKQKNGDL